MTDTDAGTAQPKKRRSWLGRAVAERTLVASGLVVLAVFAGGLIVWRPGAAGQAGGPSESDDINTPEELQREVLPRWLHVHDFGVVKVKVSQQHLFRVKNDSEVPWTVAKVHTNCSCTAAIPANRTVRPGEMFELAVRYRPPAEERIDRRRVAVRFKESAAPTLTFEVRARAVRDFSVSEKSITVDALAKGGALTRRLEVCNNSDQDWQRLDLSADKPWLRTAIRRESPDATRPWCRQRWAVEVTVVGDGLSYGRHDGSVTIRPKANELEPWVVAVAAVVNPPLEVIPSQFFLGELRTDERRSFTLLLRFSPDVCPDDPSKFEVSHDLGQALTYKITRPANTPTWVITWQVEANRLPLSNGYARGTVRVHLREGRTGTVEVPLVARVKS